MKWKATPFTDLLANCRGSVMALRCESTRHPKDFITTEVGATGLLSLSPVVRGVLGILKQVGTSPARC